MDNFLLLMRRAHLETFMALTGLALRIVELWCDRSGLSVNSKKTSLVIFMKKYKISQVNTPAFLGKRLMISDSVEYLGVILAIKLNWAKHLENHCRNFLMTLWLCRRSFGLPWGIGPKVHGRLYCALLKSRLLYAAVVWWPRVNFKTMQDRLRQLKTLAYRVTTGAMKITPTLATGYVLCEVLLHVAITAGAAHAVGRLARANR